MSWAETGVMQPPTKEPRYHQKPEKARVDSPSTCGGSVPAVLSQPDLWSFVRAATENECQVLRQKPACQSLLCVRHLAGCVHRCFLPRASPWSDEPGQYQHPCSAGSRSWEMAEPSLYWPASSYLPQCATALELPGILP